MEQKKIIDSIVQRAKDWKGVFINESGLYIGTDTPWLEIMQRIPLHPDGLESFTKKAAERVGEFTADETGFLCSLPWFYPVVENLPHIDLGGISEGHQFYITEHGETEPVVCFVYHEREGLALFEVHIVAPEVAEKLPTDLLLFSVEENWVACTSFDSAIPAHFTAHKKEEAS